MPDKRISGPTGPRHAPRQTEPRSALATRTLAVWLATVSVIAGLATGGYLLGRLWLETRAANAGLVVDKRHLDFGETWVSTGFEWVVPVRNAAARPVEVVDVITSCNCTGVTPRSFTLLPGQAQRLTVLMDVTPGLHADPAAEWWKFAVHVSPIVRGDVARQAG